MGATSRRLRFRRINRNLGQWHQQQHLMGNVFTGKEAGPIGARLVPRPSRIPSACVNQLLRFKSRWERRMVRWFCRGGPNLATQRPQRSLQERPRQPRSGRSTIAIGYREIRLLSLADAARRRFSQSACIELPMESWPVLFGMTAGRR